jgi:hypothetical protein
MRRWIANYRLQQKAGQEERQVRAHNLVDTNSALIVYDGSNKQRREAVIQLARFLKEERVKVETLAFYKRKGKEDKKPKDEAGYYYFDQKERNWLGFPMGGAVDSILSKEFDLLIDLNLESVFSLEVITTLAKASFKVGKAQTYCEKVCDMTIATKEQDIQYLIEQIKNYLQLINKR